MTLCIPSPTDEQLVQRICWFHNTAHGLSAKEDTFRKLLLDQRDLTMERMKRRLAVFNEEYPYPGETA